MYRIVEHEELAPKVHRMSIEAPMVAEKCKPGQFIILITDDRGERVPFTISGWNREAGTVDFVFIEVGSTTQQLAGFKAGDGLDAFVGPLGLPAGVEEYGHVVTLMSGYGIAGMVPVLEALKEHGNRITSIVQAPDQERVYGVERVEKLSDRVYIATGEHLEFTSQSATSVMRRLLDRHHRDPVHRVVCMGSLCLMRVVSEMTRPYEIKTMVHLTPLMVDGTGMCGACRLSVNGVNRFACVHGPEFDGHEVDGWEVMMARRCTYADESLLQQGFQCRRCSQW
jgi:ferredoxin--NADP+ reductase